MKHNYDKIKLFIVQFVRYCLIGVVNTLVAYFAFYSTFIWIKSQAISFLVSTLIGVICSYFLNSRLNFGCKVSIKKYLLFVVFMVTISYFIGYSGDFFVINPIVTFAIGLFFITPIGFLFSKYIIFK